MKAIKKLIITIVLIILVAPFCQSQNIQYRSKLRPTVKTKLDSLYPHATDVILNQNTIHDTTQIVSLNCNCQDTSDMIILVFDTNGNLQSKEVHYYGSLNGLPDTILNYIKKNESSAVEFNKKNMMKYYNNKGEISYGIIMYYSPHSWSEESYTLKFKSTGELISKELIPPEMR
jgi:hypothetical protein